MKITLLKRNNKKLSAFKRREWEFIHPEHYGKKLDPNYWNAVKIRIKAEDNGQVIGALVGTIMAGVFHLEELIIDHDKRGMGIGKSLLEVAEFNAKTYKVHVIHLETGEDWKAVSFYEKLGFKKETLLKNFYDHKNFWLMTKYL